MKKRILSLLLLLAMVVTALPLFALPSLAVEDDEATFTEGDYNALYVQEGLTVAFDIMRTNPYWKEALEEFPASPMTYTDYVYNGVHYDFTDPAQRYDWETEYYLVQATDKNGATNCGTNAASGNSYLHFKTLAEAEAAAAAQVKDGYTFKAVGPYKTTVLRGTKDGKGGYSAWTDMLSSVSNAVGYTSKEDAIAAAKKYAGVAEDAEPNALGGYESSGYVYIPIGMNQNAAYIKAGTDYYNAVNEWFAKYTWKSVAINKWSNTGATSGTQGSTSASLFNLRRDSFSIYAAVEDPIQGNGYLVRSYPFCSDQGIQLGTTSVVDGATLEMVGRIGAKATTNFIIFQNIRPTVSSSSVITTASGFTKGTAGAAIDRDALSTIRYTISNSAVAGEDTLSITQDDTVLYSSTGDYTGNNTTGIIGYLNSSGKTEVYNIRVYDRALSAPEKAQNHFADIAKWFKLDLTPLALLNDADMPALYAAVADYNFESDRDAVAKAFLDAAVAAAETKYEGIPTDFVTVAAQFGLDLSPLLELPKSFLPTTYAFLAAVTATSTGVKAGYEAALAADIAAISVGATLGYDDYNKLYVADGMTVGIDYFATNAIWNRAALGATAYIWKWQSSVDGLTGAIRMTDGSGTVSNGALHLNKNVELGETHKLNNYSQNGMTAEFVFSDATMGSGTLLNIDDVRFEGRNDGVSQLRFSAVGQRAYYQNQFYRYPESAAEVTVDGKYYVTYKGFELSKWFDYDAGIRTYVMQNKAPTYTQDYYSYYYSTIVAAYKAESKEFVVPEDDQLKKATSKTENGVTTVTLSDYTTKAKLLGGGSTFFYVAHNADGTPLTIASSDGVEHKYAQQWQFAFYKPTYTEIDGKVYITGATPRLANYGEGLGENGKDYYNLNPGSLKLTLDGEVLVDEQNLLYADNKGITGGTYLLYEYRANSVFVNRDVYAYRSYARILSDAELLQNHFADIAKYYKLNLAGFDALAAEDKAVVYAAVADMTLGEVSRDDAQVAVTAAIHKGIGKAYEAMKGDDVTVNAFIDFAAEYYLDIDKILSSKRNMASVYATAFEGARDEMQAKVDEAYHDAYYFLSYQVKGEDAWNEWLSAAAAADAVENLETLMTLPLAERVGIASVDPADADAIAAYIAKATEKYSIGLPTHDYNALYAAAESLVLAFDIMKSNTYWGEALAAFPASPMTYTAYEYDANGDGEIDPNTEVYDFTKQDNRYDWDAAYYLVEKTVVKADGTISITREGLYDRNNYGHFADEAGADAYAQSLAGVTEKNADGAYVKADGASYKVIGPYKASILRATIVNGEYTNWTDYLYTVNGAVGYDSKDDAIEAIKVLSGASEPTADGSYQNKTYAWFAIGMKQNDAYIKAGTDYYNEVNAWMAKYVWAAAEGVSVISGTNASTHASLFNTRRDSHMVYAAFENPIDGQGYLVRQTAYCTNVGIDLGGTGDYLAAEGGGAAMQVVARAPVAKSEFLIFQNMRPTVDSKTGVITAFSSFAATGDVVTGSLNPSAVESLTINFKNSAEAGKDSLVLTQGSDVIYSANGTASHSRTDMIGYNNAFSDAEIYAIRYYSRALSESELALNHFVDLAKWYRLDLTGYNMMNAEQKAAVHAVFADYTINGDADRDELMAVMSAEVAKLYEGVKVITSNEADNAKFLELATAGSLDLAPIMMLGDEAREAFAYGMLADFDLDYVIDGAVIAYHYAERTYAMAAMTFAGYQVRLDTGASLANYAGVRAVFDIDETRIAKILETEEKVTLTVSVTGAETKSYTIVYTMENDALKVDTDATIYDRAGGKSLNLTVTYKDGDFTADKLLGDFAYSYSIKVGDAAATEFAVNSATFGDKVSAAELYGYFYENGYESDRMVAEVNAVLERAALLEGLTEVSDGLYYDGVDTYYVLNAAGLTAVAYEVNKVGEYEGNIFDGKTVKLMNDIDLGGVEWTPIGNFGLTSKQFAGIFDGQGYTVSNFKVTTKSIDRNGKNRSPHGFFGNVSGTVKDLTIANAVVDVTNDGRFGGIFVGRLNSTGVIENCHVVDSSINMSVWQVGGFVGQLNAGDIIGCSIENSTVAAPGAVGALIGYIQDAGESTITDCAIKNVAVSQPSSLGASYDVMIGTLAGATGGNGSTVTVSGLVVESVTINGTVSDVLCGKITSDDAIIVDGVKLGE